MPSIFTQEYQLMVQSVFGMSLVLVAARRKCGKHALYLEDFLLVMYVENVGLFLCQYQ